MASNIESDGKTVTVTTSEGHRIGFAMAELNATSTSGEITTEWAGGVPPNSLLIPPAAIAEVEHVAPVRPAAALASAAGAPEPDRGRQLAPFGRVEPAVTGEDGHGAY